MNEVVINKSKDGTLITRTTVTKASPKKSKGKSPLDVPVVDRRGNMVELTQTRPVKS